MILDRTAPRSARTSSPAWLAGAGLFLLAMVVWFHVPLGASPSTPIADPAVRQKDELAAPETGEANVPDLASIPGTSGAWWTDVQADLARAEYAASTTPQGLLQAPNRAHNLRTTFDERGIAVVRARGRTALPFGTSHGRRLVSGARVRSRGLSIVPSAAGARVVYERDGWSEWYENSAKGLEQGFTVEQRPAAKDPLRIVGRVPAALRAQMRADGSVDFIDGHGACAIRYGELHVWDARGDQVPACLSLAGSELAIVVDDRRAEYR